MDASFIKQLLRGATIEIDTTAGSLPPIDVNSLVDDSPPGPAVKLLRPHVRMVQGGTVIFESAPAGLPRDGLPLAWIALGSVAVLAVGVWWIARR